MNPRQWFQGKLLPGGLLLSGILLVGLSMPVVSLLPRAYLPAAAIACAVLLAGAVTAYIAWITKKLAYPKKRILRHAAAIALFVLFILPFKQIQLHLFISQFMALAGIVLLGVGLIYWRRIHHDFADLYRIANAVKRIPNDIFMYGCYLAFLSLAIGISWYCFSFVPSYDDSIAQYVHGKFIAEGKFYGSHPLQQFFSTWLMINTPEKWFSPWQPLHAFMLGIGHVVGAPWLVNPAEGALTLVILYFLARRCLGETGARVSALLMLLCPFVFFMSSEFMNHSTSLLFSTLFLFAYMEMLAAKSQPGRAFRFALLAGLSLGLVFLIRPLTCLGVGLAFGLYTLYLLWKKPRQYAMPCVGIGIGIFACMLVQGWYNVNTTGDMFVLPYVQYFSHGLPGFRGDYTPLAAIVKAHAEWEYMGRALFEWVVPSLFLVLLACLLPLRNTYLRLLLSMVFVFTAVNMLNHYSYRIFGPRFIYETTPALIILSAEGIRRLPLLLRLWKVSMPTPAMRGMVAYLVIFIFATGWAYTMPGKLNVYSHYFHNKPAFGIALKKQAEKPALIFIEAPPRNKKRRDKYFWVTYTNPPRDDADVIFARDLGDEKNRRLIEYYPNRTPYLEYRETLYPIDRDTMASGGRR